MLCFIDSLIIWPASAGATCSVVSHNCVPTNAPTIWAAKTVLRNFVPPSDTGGMLWTNLYWRPVLRKPRGDVQKKFAHSGLVPPLNQNTKELFYFRSTASLN